MKKFLTLRVPTWLVILVISLSLGFAGMKAGALVSGDKWDIECWKADSSGHLLPDADATRNIGSSSYKVNVIHADESNVEHRIIDYTTSPSTYSWTATEAQMGKVIMCNSSTGDITVTLPTAIGLEGKTFTFKVTTSTGKHTIDGAGSERIDAATTHATMDAINDGITILSLGVLAGGTTDWIVIDSYIQ